MKYSISILAILLFSQLFVFAQKNKKEAEIQLPDLSEELISMRSEDQKKRGEFVKMMKKGED